MSLDPIMLALFRQLLRKGWITALECAQQGGCLSLSQRVSEMRAEGEFVAEADFSGPLGVASVGAVQMAPPGLVWTVVSAAGD